MKKTITLIVMLFALRIAYPAERYAVKSPDGSVSIEIMIRNHDLYYKVFKKGTLVIDNSKLNWIVDGRELGGQVNGIEVSRKYKGKNEYQLLGGHSLAKDHYHGATYRISSASVPGFALEVRAFNDGVAIRYSTENQRTVEVGDLTSFTIPTNTKVWLQENTKHYEGDYMKKAVETLAIGQVAGPPVVIEYPESDLYAAITEAGLYDFAGMSLQVSQERTFETRLDGKTFKSGHIQTPWRVIMVGSLNTLVNNDIITNLSDSTSAGLFKNSANWLNPGKCVWSWLTGTGVSFENMKRFSKLAGELGIEYNLVDEGWSSWEEGGKDGWELMRELVDYSAERNVKIWAWKAYPDRKGIPGLQTPERRKAFFEKCKEIGVVGLKIDFFDSEAADITTYFKETLEEAAQYGLMINFHGCNKPTGLNRTYPNEMTREGIKGYEYGMSVDCNVTLPFTRLLAGHGDATPLVLNPGQMKGTTESHQIASAIIYSSPLLCLAAHPTEIIENPNRKFISELPVVWDETIVLPPSKIGDIALMAKRSGKDWYIAGMTKEAKTLSIDCTFLGKSKYTIHKIQDVTGHQKSTSAKEMTITKNDKLQIEMNQGGGIVAKISPL